MAACSFSLVVIILCALIAPLTIAAEVTPAFVPGGVDEPQDLNGDGRYEDVNGNRRVDFADVVLYFEELNWIAENEPIVAFDYNGNTRVEFADVVLLFNVMAGPLAPVTPEPTPLPIRIEAEDYDAGGEGVGYHDTTTTNEGGTYRQDAVDIVYEDSIQSYVICYTRPSEWLQYTVNISQTGTYDASFHIGTPNTGTSLTLSMDGTTAATVSVPKTGSWSSYAEVTEQVSLTKGTHVLRIYTNGYHNIDRMVFLKADPRTPTPSPSTQTQAPIPPTLTTVPPLL